MATSTDSTPSSGYALLIAADPPVRRPFAATAVLPQLAAIPPAQLVGTAYASTVQLTNPDDPNTVLSSLRTAAAVQGPLLVYLAGQLVVDPRQHLVHLALARTTARTIRYTALPWHWIAAELQRRPPGSTTMVADLAADADAWRALGHQGQSLNGPWGPLYGAVQFRDRHHLPSPSYTQALVRSLRSSPTRPSTEQLHHQATREAVLEEESTVWLDGRASARQHPPVPEVPAPRAETALPLATAGQDPHSTISSASRAGRHDEAAAIAALWEQAALRQYGATSPQVAHWIEVRAVIALEAGSPASACALWLRGAVVRLTAGQPDTHSEVCAAVDRAHYAWHRVTDPVKARELGTELLSLRTRVTGKSGARKDVQRRLEKLSTALLP